MEVFEYLRTAFNVIKAFATQDNLIYMGLGVLGLFVLWSVFSLVFCIEIKLSRFCKKTIAYVKINGINNENYFQFTQMLSFLPAITRRKWKTYEIKKTGVPSDYILKEDCLDNELNGGFHKQNRSLMKFAMNTVVAFFFMLSIATIATTDVTITTKLLSESLIVPFVLTLLYRLNYYVYTAIRHNTYKMTEEEFQDFVNILDERIDLAVIFEGKEDQLTMFSNIYENLSEHKFFKAKKEGLFDRPRETEQELLISDEEQNVIPLNSVILTQPSQKSEKISETELKEKNALTEEEIQKSEMKKVKLFKSVLKEADKFRSGDGGIQINSTADFERILSVVEKLLDSETDNDSNKLREERTKKVDEFMSALTKYRNKK